MEHEELFRLAQQAFAQIDERKAMRGKVHENKRMERLKIKEKMRRDMLFLDYVERNPELPHLHKMFVDSIFSW